jgi:hypothetical protein
LSPLLWFKPSLDQIRFTGRNPNNGLRWTESRNGTFIAVFAEVMPDLEVQRAIPEGGATSHTFGTADTKRFIYHILIVGIFNKLTPDSSSRTKLILRSCTSGVGIRFQIPPA